MPRRHRRIDGVVSTTPPPAPSRRQRRGGRDGIASSASECGASKQRPDDEEVEDADEAERQQKLGEKRSGEVISPEVNLSSRRVILKIEKRRQQRGSIAVVVGALSPVRAVAALERALALVGALFVYGNVVA